MLCYALQNQDERGVPFMENMNMEITTSEHRAIVFKMNLQL